MKNKRIVLSIGLISLGILQFGCDGFVKSLKETNTGKVEEQQASTTENPAIESKAPVASDRKKEEESSFLNSERDLQAVEDALRNQPQFKNKPIHVYRSIHFYDDHRVSLKIQNPENPEYVDEYYYRNGTWAPAKPVVLSKHDQIAKDLVNLDRIPFRNAHRVYLALKEKSAAIGSQTEGLMVYVATSNSKLQWYPTSISNDRSKYAITFNEDGTLNSFEQE